MTVNTLTTNLANYYQQELTYTKVALTNENDLIQRSNICWYCLQRCLGAAQFAEHCGADVVTVETMYEGIKQKVTEMYYNKEKKRGTENG